MAKPILTAARLRELIHYDPATGAFTRLMSCGTRPFVGKACSASTAKGYLRFNVDATLYYAHRLAWLYIHGEWPKEMIDHINGDKGDNRIENLRDVPRSVNQQNLKGARVDNKSGLLGVSSHRYAFTAGIVIDGVHRHLGSFRSAEAAHDAYVAAKRSLHEGNTL